MKTLLNITHYPPKCLMSCFKFKIYPINIFTKHIADNMMAYIIASGHNHHIKTVYITTNTN